MFVYGLLPHLLPPTGNASLEIRPSLFGIQDEPAGIAFPLVSIGEFARVSTLVKANLSSLPSLGRWAAVVGAVAMSLFRLHAANPAPPTFRVGDVAISNIVAPFRITVANPRGDDVRLQQELKRLQPFYRFYAGTAAEAEKDFREAFATARGHLLDAVEVAFGQRYILSADRDGTRLVALVSLHANRTAGLPVSLNLAKLWAAGDNGRRYEDALAVRLREAMLRVVRADIVPEQGRPEGPEVRLIPASATYVARELATALEDARTFTWANAIALESARRDMAKSSPPGEEAMGRFLAGFVRENFQFDAALTRQARDKIAADLWTVEQFEPGQPIVRAGQRIDTRHKMALDDMASRLEAERRLAESVEAGRRSAADSARLKEELARTEAKADEERRRTRGLMALAAGLFAVSGGLLVWRASRRPVPALAMERSGPGAGMFADPEIRAGLMPHLARWLSMGLFQRLLSQRSSMIDHQKRAELEMARFEERLQKLHAPLHERLRAYEQRISELEKQLDSKAEENQELIRAVIATTRRKLEAERAAVGGP